jgi:hypothetical protein
MLDLNHRSLTFYLNTNLGWANSTQLRFTWLGLWGHLTNFQGVFLQKNTKNLALIP